MKFRIGLSAIEAAGCLVRLLIVYDRHPDGADAAVTDMLTTNNYLSGYNVDGPMKGRFQFLTDINIAFQTNQLYWVNKFFFKKDLKVVYSGNTGDVTDVDRGNFMVIGIGVGNAAAININFGYVFKYTDD